MGELAVPKLDLAIRNNANLDLRLAAAFCLTDIGGPQAMESLQWAADSGSDGCVRRFAKIALQVSKLERESNAKGSKPELEAELNLRSQLLDAFRCNTN